MKKREENTRKLSEAIPTQLRDRPAASGLSEANLIQLQDRPVARGTEDLRPETGDVRLTDAIGQENRKTVEMHESISRFDKAYRDGSAANASLPNAIMPEYEIRQVISLSDRVNTLSGRVNSQSGSRENQSGWHATLSGSLAGLSGFEKNATGRVNILSDRLEPQSGSQYFQSGKGFNLLLINDYLLFPGNKEHRIRNTESGNLGKPHRDLNLLLITYYLLFLENKKHRIRNTESGSFGQPHRGDILVAPDELSGQAPGETRGWSAPQILCPPFSAPRLRRDRPALVTPLRLAVLNRLAPKKDESGSVDLCLWVSRPLSPTHPVTALGSVDDCLRFNLNLSTTQLEAKYESVDDCLWVTCHLSTTHPVTAFGSVDDCLRVSLLLSTIQSEAKCGSVGDCLWVTPSLCLTPRENPASFLSFRRQEKSPATALWCNKSLLFSAPRLRRDWPALATGQRKNVAAFPSDTATNNKISSLISPLRGDQGGLLIPTSNFTRLLRQGEGPVVHNRAQAVRACLLPLFTTLTTNASAFFRHGYFNN